ncbi:PIN domain-containing protein [Glutamicibacter creatinolyticus]|jgi:hypothetical protein|uniref:PIN domain-containing protein n=1 Tax=Glutamicibacter TaxID=1742989 RepID=UPI0037C08872
MPQRVFVDANVLFSRTLRDWLFLLRVESEGGMFQIHTTWDVITEAGARLRDQYPEQRGNLVSGVIAKCQTIFDEILQDYPGGPISGISDREDWHVHHAAEACHAQILLTEDTGFDSDATFYEVYTCDDFFAEIAASAPEVVRRVVKFQASYWAKRNGKPLPEALREAQCPNFARIVQKHLQNLAHHG